ncbi:hypothetical protein [Rhizobium rhizogenes]|uniref:hypothetical protein n=1 Tax=Rhizobium rhizogenes TaxID=359 RepID=UPI000689F743|nr:hypothetical protein [Rhizobium rhizogenes]QUE80022.1 hypothetical protein EML492_18850 [Rhizobium rhizogenes]
MSEFEVSTALLRTLPRLMSRADPTRDQRFASGEGTKAATEAYQRQSASIAAGRVVKQSARQKPLPEEREKAIGRRRTWAGGGNMPPGVRAGYSEAERAALSVIAERCKHRGYCDLCLDEIARLAGASRTSVQNAIRKARSKERGHISVRERPQEGRKSLTNIIRIVCSSWLKWIERAIGFKRLNTSKTGVKNSLSLYAARLKMALEGSEDAASETVFQVSHQDARSAHSFGGVAGG